MKRLITIVIILDFLVTNLAYGLNVSPGSNDPVIRDEMASEASQQFSDEKIPQKFKGPDKEFSLAETERDIMPSMPGLDLSTIPENMRGKLPVTTTLFDGFSYLNNGYAVRLKTIISEYLKQKGIDLKEKPSKSAVITLKEANYLLHEYVRGGILFCVSSSLKGKIYPENINMVRIKDKGGQQIVNLDDDLVNSLKFFTADMINYYIERSPGFSLNKSFQKKVVVSHKMENGKSKIVLKDNELALLTREVFTYVFGEKGERLNLLSELVYGDGYDFSPELIRMLPPEKISNDSQGIIPQPGLSHDTAASYEASARDRTYFDIVFKNITNMLLKEVKDKKAKQALNIIFEMFLYENAEDGFDFDTFNEDMNEKIEALNKVFKNISIDSINIIIDMLESLFVKPPKEKLTRITPIIDELKQGMREYRDHPKILEYALKNWLNPYWLELYRKHISFQEEKQFNRWVTGTSFEKKDNITTYYNLVNIIREYSVTNKNNKLFLLAEHLHEGKTPGTKPLIEAMEEVLQNGVLSQNQRRLVQHCLNRIRWVRREHIYRAESIENIGSDYYAYSSFGSFFFNFSLSNPLRIGDNGVEKIVAIALNAFATDKAVGGREKFRKFFTEAVMECDQRQVTASLKILKKAFAGIEITNLAIAGNMLTVLEQIAKGETLEDIEELIYPGYSLPDSMAGPAEEGPGIRSTSFGIIFKNIADMVSEEMTDEDAKEMFNIIVDALAYENSEEGVDILQLSNRMKDDIEKFETNLKEVRPISIVNLKRSLDKLLGKRWIKGDHGSVLSIFWEAISDFLKYPEKGRNKHFELDWSATERLDEYIESIGNREKQMFLTWYCELDRKSTNEDVDSSVIFSALIEILHNYNIKNNNIFGIEEGILRDGMSPGSMPLMKAMSHIVNDDSVNLDNRKIAAACLNKMKAIRNEFVYESSSEEVLFKGSDIIRYITYYPLFYYFLSNIIRTGFLDAENRSVKQFVGISLSLYIIANMGYDTSKERNVFFETLDKMTTEDRIRSVEILERVFRSVGFEQGSISESFIKVLHEVSEIEKEERMETENTQAPKEITKALTEEKRTWVWQAVNLMHKTHMEIYVPQTVCLTGKMKAVLCFAKKRAKEKGGTLSVLRYKSKDLADMLCESNDNAKKVIVVDGESAKYIQDQILDAYEHGDDEYIDLFRNVRMLNIYISQIRRQKNEIKRTKFQAQMIMTAILAGLLDRRWTHTMEIQLLLTDIMGDYFSINNIEKVDFLKALSHDESKDTVRKIVKRIQYFIADIPPLKLIDMLDKLHWVTHEFWKYA